MNAGVEQMDMRQGQVSVHEDNLQRVSFKMDKLCCTRLLVRCRRGRNISGWEFLGL